MRDSPELTTPSDGVSHAGGSRYETEVVQFYLPRRLWPSDPLPDSADNPLHYPEGILTHTLQTYLRLRHSQYPCRLVDRLPRRGLVVSHRSLIARASFSPDLFLVNMLADRGPHLWAQAVVVQNPVQAERPGHSLIPQWPQPGLIPRDLTRGNRFEVVAYMGRRSNLAPELCTGEWVERLRAIGLNWRIVDHPRHDYFEIDAAVAARDFSSPSAYVFKPAAKLVNAWRAGVVPIASPEPAHLALRSSELDYISVNSADEVFDALKALKDDPTLRQRIMAHGRARGEAFSPDRVTELWRRYLDEVAWPGYRAWLARGRGRRWWYYATCCARWPFQHRERRRIRKDW